MGQLVPVILKILAKTIIPLTVGLKTIQIAYYMRKLKKEAPKDVDALRRSHE